MVVLTPSRYLMMMRVVRSAGFVAVMGADDAEGVGRLVPAGFGVDVVGGGVGVAVGAGDSSGDEAGVGVDTGSSSVAARAGIDGAINALAEITATTARFRAENFMFSSDPFSSNAIDASEG